MQFIRTSSLKPGARCRHPCDGKWWFPMKTPFGKERSRSLLRIVWILEKLGEQILTHRLTDSTQYRLRSKFSRYRWPLRLLLPFLFSLYLLNGVSGGRMESRAQQASEADAEFFRSQILPLLAKRCQSCDNDTLKLSGLTLESATGLQNGGSHGPVVTAGNPQQSSLYRRVAGLEKPSMPMNGDPLPQAEVNLLKAWIEQGAAWPESVTPNHAGIVPGTAALSTPDEPPQALSGNSTFFKKKVHPIFSARSHHGSVRSSGYRIVMSKTQLNHCGAASAAVTQQQICGGPVDALCRATAQRSRQGYDPANPASLSP